MTHVSHPFAVMCNSQVKTLWSVMSSVLKVYCSQFQGGKMGAALDTDILQSAPVNSGEIHVPKDEIVR